MVVTADLQICADLSLFLGSCRVFSGEQFPVVSAAVVRLTGAAAAGSGASGYLAGAGGAL